MIGERFMRPFPCEVIAETPILSWRIQDGKEVEHRYTAQVVRPLTAQELRDAGGAR